MRTKHMKEKDATWPAPEPSSCAEWQLHRLDELYRLVGLAPLHAYQAALADLRSLRGEEEEKGGAA